MRANYFAGTTESEYQFLNFKITRNAQNKNTTVLIKMIRSTSSHMIHGSAYGVFRGHEAMPIVGQKTNQFEP